ncbi:TfoX/Sxy family protein [Derxia gummosa]|uniref:TfoX/Sxy family protein n=1 Tax=Derxia gummosa DSM 723 TaxID=1121388 RepID=A0A8B6XCX5_9BURK|nr:TfoX/Sxy family protein [Derxia gummosa]
MSPSGDNMKDGDSPLQSSAANESALRELSQLANLGPKSAAWLIAAGITSVSEIRALGSVASYVRVKRAGMNASLNLLWALEGAISDQPWQTVAREHRTSLLLALDEYSRR